MGSCRGFCTAPIFFSVLLHVLGFWYRVEVFFYLSHWFKLQEANVLTYILLYNQDCEYHISLQNPLEESPLETSSATYSSSASLAIYWRWDKDMKAPALNGKEQDRWAGRSSRRESLRETEWPLWMLWNAMADKNYLQQDCTVSPPVQWTLSTVPGTC